MKINSYKKDGQTFYKFNAYLGQDPLTGKKIHTNRQGFKTKKDAEIAYLKLKTQTEERIKERNYTFKDVYDIWIKQYQMRVAPTTFKKTVAHFKNHTLPVFADMRITKITFNICQNFINDNYYKFVKPSFLLSNLNEIFKYAIKMGIIQNNPAINVEIPKIKRIAPEKPINFWDKPTLLKFLEYAKEDLTETWYTYFYLLAFTGLRRSEALALHWNDIDFKEHTLSIKRNLSNGHMVLKPKTKSSIRTISLDTNTINILKKYRQQQLPILNNPIIFRNTKDNYITLSQPLRQLEKIIKKRDLPRISVHGFRHTHCSLLFESGATIKQVQDRLGHANIKTTMDVYAHVTKSAKKDVADSFANFMLS